MRYTYLLLTALLAVGLLFPANAQEVVQDSLLNEVKQLKWKKKLKVGDDLYNRGSYYNAVEVYNMAWEDKPDHSGIAFKIAETHYMLRDYSSAATWYKNVIELDSLGYPTAQYYRAKSLKQSGKYDEAIVAFQNFVSTTFKKETDEVTELKRGYEDEIAGCELGKESMEAPSDVIVEHLDENVNHPLTDFSPFEMEKNKLVYAALTADTTIALPYEDEELQMDTDLRFARFYVSEKTDNGWQPAYKYSIELNNGQYHVGNGVFSEDGERFYYTQCVEMEDMSMKCDIYYADKNGSFWDEPMPLSAVNGDGHTSTHPFAVTDGEGTEWVYYASNREGGQGGMDLWRVEVTASGFGSPENISGVNTENDEVTPYFMASENTLYFSSNGLVNMGGFDIYNSIWNADDEEWSVPSNMGYPLNSPLDDIYFRFGVRDDKGFLVSNRAGGASMKSPTCCDDILAFRYPPKFAKVEGQLKNKETDEVIKDEGLVYVYRADNDSLVGSYEIDENGSYNFTLPAEVEYKVVASTTKFYEEEQTLDTRDLDDENVSLDFYLKERPFYPGMQLGVVYYDYDMAKLRDDARETLDTVVNFLEHYPKCKIEVAGHTDSIADNEYNLKLSLDRAEAVLNYLVMQGIDEEQLIKKGYGEDRPAAPNTNPDGTDNPEGRQLNRRTEFEVIEILDEAPAADDEE